MQWFEPARKRDTQRVKKVLERARKYDFDEIYKIYEDIDFVEVRGHMGGDLRCYRYYKNGECYER